MYDESSAIHTNLCVCYVGGMMGSQGAQVNRSFLNVSIFLSLPSRLDIVLVVGMCTDEVSRMVY